MFQLLLNWLIFCNKKFKLFQNDSMKVNKMLLHLMSSGSKQNINSIERYYEKHQILISLKDINKSVKN